MSSYFSHISGDIILVSATNITDLFVHTKLYSILPDNMINADQALHCVSQCQLNHRRLPIQRYISFYPGPLHEYQSANSKAGSEHSISNTKMPFSVTALYSNSPDATFDAEYYTKTHLPLMVKHWEQFGLLQWSFVEYRADADGLPPAYRAGTTLVWKDAEGFAAAISKPEGRPVLEDAANYSNKGPTFLTGVVVASGNTSSST